MKDAKELEQLMNKLQHAQPVAVKFNMSKWTADTFKDTVKRSVMLVPDKKIKPLPEGVLGTYAGIPFFEVPWLADGFVEVVNSDGSRCIIDIKARPNG